jgi:hypothetical protein
MNVTFACSRCDQAARVDVPGSADSLACPHCQGRIQFPHGAWSHGQLSRCLVCPCTELFLRKDFPQRLGVAIVSVGFLGSTIAWYYHWIFTAYAALFATALLDVVLYFFVGQALVCYRCQAHYRQVAGLDLHSPFSLETHERYRQQAARLAEQSLGGTP